MQRRLILLIAAGTIYTAGRYYMHRPRGEREGEIIGQIGREDQLLSLIEQLRL